MADQNPAGAAPAPTNAATPPSYSLVGQYTRDLSFESPGAPGSVLLGGVAFEGGAGRITGVVAGVLIIGALQNGLVLIGVSQFLQTVFIGLTLIIAVALDGTLQGIISRSWEALGTKQKAREEAVEAA